MIVSSVGKEVQVEEGEYLIHSRFRQVINLSTKGLHFVSLVDNSIGPGPFNICLKNFVQKEGKKMSFSCHSLPC